MSDLKFIKNRREFIKEGIAGLAGITVFNSSLQATTQNGVKEKNDEFIYRLLGKTGIKLPIVSMGVMNANNPQLVQTALDAGIVLLDTAHRYQEGRNEEMIGQAVKDETKRVLRDCHENSARRERSQNRNFYRKNNVRGIHQKI